jgi:hypothetical protein
MSLAGDSAESRLATLDILGGLLALIDSIWGVLMFLPVDLRLLPEVLVGISLVLAFPAYVMDLRSRKQIIIFMPVVFAFRWLALSLLVHPPMFVAPWRFNLLLIAACILLQWSKLRTNA